MEGARLTVVGGTKGARRNLALLILLYLLALWLAATALRAEEGPPVHITRAPGPITIDADLSDPGWKGATRLETWYETNPGDNIEPKVKTKKGVSTASAQSTAAHSARRLGTAKTRAQRCSPCNRPR